MQIKHSGQLGGIITTQGMLPPRTAAFAEGMLLGPISLTVKFQMKYTQEVAVSVTPICFTGSNSPSYLNSSNHFGKKNKKAKMSTTPSYRELNLKEDSK